MLGTRKAADNYQIQNLLDRQNATLSIKCKGIFLKKKKIVVGDFFNLLQKGVIFQWRQPFEESFEEIILKRLLNKRGVGWLVARRQIVEEIRYPWYVLAQSLGVLNI